MRDVGWRYIRGPTINSHGICFVRKWSYANSVKGGRRQRSLSMDAPPLYRCFEGEGGSEENKRRDIAKEWTTTAAGFINGTLYSPDSVAETTETCRDGDRFV